MTESCGCKGTFILQCIKYNIYFSSMVEVYQCDGCGHIWHKLIEEASK